MLDTTEIIEAGNLTSVFWEIPYGRNFPTGLLEYNLCCIIRR